MELRALASWVAHSQRWRARLDGVVAAAKPSGFVAARVSPHGGKQETVRVDLKTGGGVVQLHWPLGGAHELAALLRENVNLTVHRDAGNHMQPAIAPRGDSAG